MSASDLIRRMHAHERWATESVMGALRGIEDPPQEALDRMAHVAAAAEVWLSRIDRNASPPGELFPTGAGLHEVAERIQRVDVAYHEVLDRLSDEDCERVVPYISGEGEQHESTLGDILTHLALHAQYHRGQVARTLRDRLPEPVPTDYIVFTRS